jgi:hypothetical protein
MMMDPADLAPLDLFLGVTLIAMALLTAWLRISGRHHLLGFREAMREGMGERRGDMAHTLLYTIAPAILGVCFLVLWTVRRGA